MTDISKWMNIAIADVNKIMGVEKANLSKFMGLDIAAGDVWYSRYDWNKCFTGSHECIVGAWAFAQCSGISVYEFGTWSEGYRPTKVRITHNGTGTGLRIYIRDTNGGLVGDSGANYVSGSEISLTWGSYNLQRFIIDNFDSYGTTFSNVEWESASEPAACGGGS